jgi:hypothetical protein
MKQEKENSEMLKGHSRAIAAMFVSILVITGLVSVFSEGGTVSVLENRALAPLPKITPWSLFSGAYTDSVELYYADNFPFREALFGVATAVRDLSGYHTEVIYYQADAAPVLTEKIDTLAAAVEDTLTVKAGPDTIKVAAEFDRSAGVIVYNKHAIQLFTGSGDAAKRFAGMVNLYKATFDTLDIYCLIAPTAIDFYLPDEYKTSANYEFKTIDLIRDNLDSAVHFVDAYGELEKHIAEYIYFNTDHHWTGRGAYYAYAAFCRSAGIEPHAIEGFERQQAKRRFLGSLYGITLDKTLKSNKDSLEYFKPNIPTKTFRYNKDSARYEVSKLFANTHNYANFIGGDLPMVRIESEVNERKILIIKDSFGNAVAPYLTLHFGTIYVMDYRYFDMNVTDFVRRNGISDILFLHNTFSANAKYSAYRGRYLLNWGGAAVPEIKVVSDTTNSSQDGK